MRRWLVTGAAGFIGSHLVEQLLRDGQQVVALDNFSTGHRHNLDDVRARVGAQAWQRLQFIEGDIRDTATCRQAVEGVERVLHQAALGSVPRSLAQPLDSFASNVDGFVKLLDAARLAGVQRFVYASSSSVYGDSPVLPKREDAVGNPLSPYAATKAADELFAGVFARSYGFQSVGLRYFNVFGPRQDPNGAYAAVIPRWVQSLRANEPVYINGDGLTSRDFCFVANAVQANIKAALAAQLPSPHLVLNVAVGERTTLNQLFVMLRDGLARRGVDCAGASALLRDFRAGDVAHSLADITLARQCIGYAPTHTLQTGIDAMLDALLASDPGTSR